MGFPSGSPSRSRRWIGSGCASFRCRIEPARSARSRLIPACFDALALAGELADEWVDTSRSPAEPSSSAVTWSAGRSAISATTSTRGFGEQPRCRLGPAASRSGRYRWSEWERTLPARFSAGLDDAGHARRGGAAAISMPRPPRSATGQCGAAPPGRRIRRGGLGAHAGSRRIFAARNERALVRAAWEWVNRLV